MNIQCKCICRLCGKPLVKIGNARKNGANHIDWNSRKYHKKCTFEGKALDVKRASPVSYRTLTLELINTL